MRGYVDGFGGEVRGAGEFLGGICELGGMYGFGKGGSGGGGGDGIFGGKGRWMGEVMRGRTYFEEVGDAGLGEVDVGVGGIFGLGIVRGGFRGGVEGRGEGRVPFLWDLGCGDWVEGSRCGRIVRLVK